MHWTPAESQGWALGHRDGQKAQEAWALLSGSSRSEIVAFKLFNLDPLEETHITLWRVIEEKESGGGGQGPSGSEISEGRMEEAAFELGPEWWRDACNLDRLCWEGQLHF